MIVRKISYSKMRQKVSFTVTHANEAVESFSEDSHRTLVEILGSETLERSELICQGRPVNKFLSLSHQNIVDGSNLILVEFRTTSSRLEYLSQTLKERSWFGFMKEDNEARSKRHELARVNDVMWSTRELSPCYSAMMGLAVRAVEQRDQEMASNDTDMVPMNTEAASEISVAPLPICFAPEDIPAGRRRRKLC
jgi:hypothetical protein